MNVFMQGMRRSGTTIVFDILSQDPRLDGWYEPLALAQSPAVGGGSEATDTDYFAKLRQARDEFFASHPGLGHRELNHGAPTDPAREMVEGWPQHIRDYLASLIARGERSVLKFTRAYHQMRELHALDPGARVVIITRDPRAVATSYLMGKSRVNAPELEPGNRFFEQRGEFVGWNAWRFAELLFERPDYAHLRDIANFERVMLVWKNCVEASIAGARKHFPGRWMLLRHHDLTLNPLPTVDALYRFLELDVPPRVSDWVASNVRDRMDIHQPGNPAWDAAIARLGLGDTLTRWALCRPDAPISARPRPWWKRLLGR